MLTANGEKASIERSARGLKAIDEVFSFVKFATLKRRESVAFIDQQVVRQFQLFQLLYFPCRPR